MVQNKKEIIVEFLEQHKNDGLSCANALKLFEQESQTKVSYVYFNRAYREICPQIKKNDKPKPPPTKNEHVTEPKNERLVSLKTRIRAIELSLRSRQEQLQKAEEEADVKGTFFYLRLCESDRKGLIACYEDLLEFYENKYANEIVEVNKRIAENDKKRSETIGTYLKSAAKIINEQDIPFDEELEDKPELSDEELKKIEALTD